MATIQWFPGHMAKARREITEKLNLVDLVIELRDSRIPYSSKNPMVDEIVGKKPRLIILNKANMADKTETKKWIEALTDENTVCLDIDCISLYNVNKVVQYAKLVLKDKLEANQRKGIAHTTIKAVVLGIPNVGKSTFINTLGKRKATKVGDKPGVTKGQTWIKISDELMLLDTPGILWPKFEDQEIGRKIAICGSIKDEILALDEICLAAIKYIKENYKDLLMKRYSLDDITDLSEDEILKEIGKKRGCVIKGGEIDLERAQTIVLNDVRKCQIGEITFERANQFI